MSRTVLVCGGRTFHDGGLVEQTLNQLHAHTPITHLVHGGAQGADRLGGLWAWSMKIRCTVVHPDWVKHGKRAGPLRNQEMLDTYAPSLVVAFPGGRGTEDMVRRAIDAGVAVFVPSPKT